MNWASLLRRGGRYGPPLLLCALLGLPGLVGCSVVSPGSPPLPDSTFSRLLVEMHLLSMRAERKDGLPPSMRDSVFQHYGVEREDFRATLRYYSRRPVRLDALYDGVVDTLSAIEQRSRYRGTAPPGAGPSP